MEMSKEAYNQNLYFRTVMKLKNKLMQLNKQKKILIVLVNLKLILNK